MGKKRGRKTRPATAAAESEDGRTSTFPQHHAAHTSINSNLGSSRKTRKGKGKGAHAALSPSPTSTTSPRQSSSRMLELPPHIQDWFEDGKRMLMAWTQRKAESTPEQVQRARTKIHELSTSSDTKGIRFTGSALHLVYFETKFVRRGTLLYTLFHTLINDPSCAALRQAVCEPWTQPSQHPLSVISCGGGPGTDASGLVWVCKTLLPQRRHVPAITCHLMDFEKSWKRYEATLNTLFKPQVEVSFVHGDVCTNLQADINRHVGVLVPAADLFIFSYVCHETSGRSVEGGLAFYQDIAKAAKPGSVFIFLDVMRHSAKHFGEIQLAMTSACDSVLAHDTSLPALAQLPTQLLIISKRII
ncbi:hypothetical protein PTSG_01808 [Salpingoeca rosetta]|uniref:Uncharacterized protein n=1 Tax=Salpingoeca rosetta (strain ATCC 50818 / BSB-021) TaxID=946362 RepID=F2TZ08_SALR5|nr:uncharacterized protein PTSG_01808 [Salpingoeca rosetta]EGD78832.1 hypothetical protein PTSG_01808 [Salpingoeca rosetta]|eukprot:XP_004997788.1 hypothetical protein PTSG_01808 [Salpingoeca rosetta]